MVERPSLKKPKVDKAKFNPAKIQTIDSPEATAPQYFMEQPDTNKNLKVVKKNTSELPE